MDGTPVRLFDTWLHYLPDMRLVPTEQSETDILAWDDAGTRDNEIRRDTLCLAADDSSD